MFTQEIHLNLPICLRMYPNTRCILADARSRLTVIGADSKAFPMGERPVIGTNSGRRSQGCKKPSILYDPIVVISRDGAHSGSKGTVRKRRF